MNPKRVRLNVTLKVGGGPEGIIPAKTEFEHPFPPKVKVELERHLKEPWRNIFTVLEYFQDKKQDVISPVVEEKESIPVSTKAEVKEEKAPPPEKLKKSSIPR